MTHDEYLAFRDERLPDLRHFARHNIPITAHLTRGERSEIDEARAEAAARALAGEEVAA